MGAELRHVHELEEGHIRTCGLGEGVAMSLVSLELRFRGVVITLA